MLVLGCKQALNCLRARVRRRRAWSLLRSDLRIEQSDLGLLLLSRLALVLGGARANGRLTALMLPQSVGLRVLG